MRIAMVVLMALGVGCGTVDVDVGITDEAAFLQRLWSGIFDGPGGVPRVQWEEDDRLDPECGGRGWLADDGVNCVDGSTVLPHLVLVARWPGGQLWQTALAHELAHARDLAWGSDGDPGHQSAAFQPGGDVWRGEVWLRQETEQGRVPAGMVVQSATELRIAAQPLSWRSACLAGGGARPLGHEASGAGPAAGGLLGRDGERPGRPGDGLRAGQ